MTQPIHIIIDGTDYFHWGQAFQNFLRRRKLWKYVTDSVTVPIAIDGESSDKFNKCFEEWDSNNHKIITQITNNSIPAINHLFKCLDTTKGVLDFLANCYTTTNLSH